MYFLKNIDTDMYVAKPGSLRSYTNKLENAKQFETTMQAEQERCSNERIVQWPNDQPIR